MLTTSLRIDPHAQPPRLQPPDSDWNADISQAALTGLGLQGLPRLLAPSVTTFLAKIDFNSQLAVPHGIPHWVSLLDLRTLPSRICFYFKTRRWLRPMQEPVGNFEPRSREPAPIKVRLSFRTESFLARPSDTDPLWLSKTADLANHCPSATPPDEYGVLPISHPSFIQKLGRWSATIWLCWRSVELIIF